MIAKLKEEDDEQKEKELENPQMKIEGIAAKCEYLASLEKPAQEDADKELSYNILQRKLSNPVNIQTPENPTGSTKDHKEKDLSQPSKPGTTPPLSPRNLVYNQIHKNDEKGKNITEETPLIPPEEKKQDMENH